MKLTAPKNTETRQETAPAREGDEAPRRGGTAAARPQAPKRAPRAGRAAKAKGAPAPVDASTRARKRLSVACGALAGVAALSLGLAAWQGNAASTLKQKYEGDMVAVAVASKDIAAGAVIASGDVQVSEVPRAWAPADAETSTSSLVGHQAIVGIASGTPISSGYVQASGTPANLAQAIEAGHVAYMMDASGAQALSPMLHVGDEVNLIVGSGTNSSTLLDHVKIIALDGKLSGAPDSGYSTITLDLTEDQATQVFEVVEQGQSAWRLTLPPAADNASAQGAGDGEAL